MTLDQQLTSHGYEIGETGGGCTAYLKNVDGEKKPYFILTICYRNDKLPCKYETDATHPEDWPVYFGLCDEDCCYIIESIMSPVIHNIDALITAEIWSLKNKKDLEQY